MIHTKAWPLHVFLINNAKTKSLDFLPIDSPASSCFNLSGKLAPFYLFCGSWFCQRLRFLNLSVNENWIQFLWFQIRRKRNRHEWLRLISINLCCQVRIKLKCWCNPWNLLAMTLHKECLQALLHSSSIAHHPNRPFPIRMQLTNILYAFQATLESGSSGTKAVNISNVFHGSSQLSPWQRHELSSVLLPCSGDSRGEKKNTWLSFDLLYLFEHEKFKL